MSKLVYLAGPITGCSFEECVRWREEFCEELTPLGIECLSPMRGKGYLKNESSILDSYSSLLLCEDKGIMSRDHFDCNRADVIVFNVLGARKPSLGTTMEAAWGFHRHTPMVWIMEQNGNPHDHSMLRQCMNFIVPGITQAIRVVEAILSPSVGHR